MLYFFKFATSDETLVHSLTYFVQPTGNRWELSQWNENPGLVDWSG